MINIDGKQIKLQIWDTVSQSQIQYPSPTFSLSLTLSSLTHTLSRAVFLSSPLSVHLYYV